MELDPRVLDVLLVRIEVTFMQRKLSYIDLWLSTKVVIFSKHLIFIIPTNNLLILFRHPIRIKMSKLVARLWVCVVLNVTGSSPLLPVAFYQNHVSCAVCLRYCNPFLSPPHLSLAQGWIRQSRGQRQHFVF